MSITESRPVITHQRPVINRASPMRRKIVLFTNNLPPCQLEHTARDGCAQYSHPNQCAYSEEHTPCPLVKHFQHTVNPLIAPYVSPFLPSAISTVSVLFLALITVLVSLGCQWHQVSSAQCQNVPQSR
ncbi:unnamed protein product [Staurois parvus]|uniref:Uncharacterized protein n=1 Tax=Staurois parvus TaxID=386267 RepID=A0ABN9DUY4_9NEOB|nr:unnamed protein product [Staurois parvus]